MAAQLKTEGRLDQGSFTGNLAALVYLARAIRTPDAEAGLACGGKHCIAIAILEEGLLCIRNAQSDSFSRSVSAKRWDK